MWTVLNWILILLLLVAVSYSFYSQMKFQSTYKSSIFSSFGTDCTIYSVAQPSGVQNVNGKDICQQRGAGNCIFAIKYENINDALTGVVGAAGSNLGIVESCQVQGKDDSTVAYCCRE